MNLLLSIALRHLLARKRQSIVSLSGIVIGVAFFLAISSLMKGSQDDFIKRMVDNSPHITISDEFRAAGKQPLEMLYPDALLEISNVKPLTETRGIRNYKQILESLRAQKGYRASAVQTGSVILNYAGQEININLNGMIPQEIRGITTIDEHMKEGTLESLYSNRNGIIIGSRLQKRMSLNMGDNLTLVSSVGQIKIFKIVGVFQTGRGDYDLRQAFVDIKPVQAITNKTNRANSIIMKLDEPENAVSIAEEIESKIKYKTVSWQENAEDIMNTIAIRNMIMYSVVSAVLVVAAFGIYNIISTVVIEKHKDIAILKSMGFRARDIRTIFISQGIILGFAGIAAGLPLGSALMSGLMQIQFTPPGSEKINMPVDWGITQFLIASAFALSASILAAWLPANKGSKVMPVDILRGGQ